MPKYYENIFGWTDFYDIYQEVVDKFDNCIFIEIGSFQGKSACYMAELIKEKKKNIKLVCIDLFPTVDELDKFADIGAGQGVEGEIIRALPDSILNVFVKNMQNAGVDDIVIPIKSDSHKAALMFKLFREKIDALYAGGLPIKFCFVDAGHGYSTVKEDIKLWLELVCPEDGIIAGHDYFDGVYKAVNEIFKDENRKVYRKTSSWYVDLANEEDYA